MDQARNIFLFDRFEWKLAKKENRLSLEIEDPASGRSFFICLDSDAIPQLSQDIFADANSMYQGLEDALKQLHKEVHLSFDGEGNFEYSVSFSVGIVKKNLHFTIFLQEKHLEPWVILERKMEYRFNQVFSKFEEIESQGNLSGEKVGHQKNEESYTPSSVGKEINKIQNENKYIIEAMDRLEKALFERLDKLEQRVEKIEASSQGSKDIVVLSHAKQEILDISKICPESFLTWRQKDDKGDYVIEKSSKTFERVSKNSAHKEVYFSQMLPMSGVYVINLKLDFVEKGLWIGLVSEQDFTKENWHQCDVYYSSYKGDFFEASNKITNQKKTLNVNTGKTGDVISMKFDIDRGFICVEVNGTEVNSILKNLKDKIYIPYVGTYYGGEKVTIL